MAVGAARLLSLLGRLKPAASAASKATKATKGAGLNFPARVLDTYGQLGKAVVSAAPTVAAVAAPPAVGLGLVSAGLNAAPEDAKEGFLSNFGLDAETRGKNDTSFDRSTGSIKNGFGTWATSVLLGQDSSQLNEAAQKASNKKILDSTTLDEQLTAALGKHHLSTAGLKLRDTESKEQYGARLLGIQNSLDAYNTAAEVLDPADMARLVDSTTGELKSASVINGIVSNKDPFSQRNQARKSEERALRLEQRQLDQQDFQNKLADYNFRLSEARLTEQSRQAEAQRQQTLQFKIMDRQDARMDRADRLAAADRADRRAAISSMVKGLSQLGYAFSL